MRLDHAKQKHRKNSFYHHTYFPLLMLLIKLLLICEHVKVASCKLEFKKYILISKNKTKKYLSILSGLKNTSVVTVGARSPVNSVSQKNWDNSS